MPLTLVTPSQLATMALCATLKSVSIHYIYAEWLGGACWWVSRNGWQRSFSDEGRVLFAASVYLLKQDVVRVSLSTKHR
jgi:hypothetical protein